jgi:NAD dependent epimerase/dehydratase family enzyme
MKGVYNAVAPNPVSHRELMNTIASVKGGIKLPIPVPSFLLKIMLGELSTEVLKSCTVSGQKILDAGFTVKYPHIEPAVRHILEKD